MNFVLDHFMQALARQHMRQVRNLIQKSGLDLWRLKSAISLL